MPKQAASKTQRKTSAKPPHGPVAPAGYSGTPLPKKLGIKPGSRVALVRAPRDFTATLGSLPEGATLATRAGAGTSLAVWFLRSRSELTRDLPRIAAQASLGPVWLAWPKQSSGLTSDLSESGVRTPALAAGLVDYKVAALDATWSGLLFALRRGNR